jgi:phosphoribosylglycinamide formyltransferase-1
MKRILFFASGNGSNVDNIVNYFKNNDSISTVGIFSNNPNAKVLEKAKSFDIFSFVFNKEELAEVIVLEKIKSLQPDLIVLAGFLWKFPEHIIAQYPKKIINIHPALLPKYGGKGMFGMHVHQAVFENHEKETGITIHYVTKNYDEGEFIFQKSVTIENCKTAGEIANKVQTLEHEYFPQIIERLLTSNI